MHIDIIFDIRGVDFDLKTTLFPSVQKRPWANYVYMGSKVTHILESMPTFEGFNPLLIPPERLPELLLIKDLSREQIITYFTTP